jgi:hypothetical protein
MDPLHPIAPGAVAPPSRRVPPVDRLRRVTRDGDRPERETGARDDRRQPPEEPPDEQPGDGHVDVRV